MAKKSPTPAAARTALGLLNASGRKDEELVQVLDLAAGFKNRPVTLSLHETQNLVRQVQDSGDARHGAEVFGRPQLGCVACHMINGQGGTVGPDLSAIGTAHPVDFIIGAILEPQKEIKEGYMSISVTTKDAEEYQGYLVRETADELVLRDVLQNKEVRLRRDKIAEKKQHGSVMPSGLADSLTSVEFRDLIRYLSELGK